MTADGRVLRAPLGWHAAHSTGPPHTELWGLEGRGGGGLLHGTATGTLPEVDASALLGTRPQRSWGGQGLYSQIGFLSGRKGVLGERSG